MKKLLTTGVVCLTLFFLATMASGLLFAQEVTGSIRGVVLDPSGAAIPSATVAATQVETGLTRVALAAADGSFVLVQLPIGHYRLEVKAPHFQTYRREGISLSVDQTAAVRVHLALGSEQQVVQVRSDAALIEPARTSLGKTVYEREILDLPLNGRNFSQLGLLQPGVAPITAGLSDAGGGIRDGEVPTWKPSVATTRMSVPDTVILHHDNSSMPGGLSPLAIVSAAFVNITFPISRVSCLSYHCTKRAAR